MKSVLTPAFLAFLALFLSQLLPACILTVERDPSCPPPGPYRAPQLQPAHVHPHPPAGQPGYAAREAAYEPAPYFSTFGSGAPRLQLLLGQRSLDEGDYEPVEDQVALGVEVSQEVPGSAFGWELGLIGSFDEDPVSGIGDVEGRTAELYAGLRKTIAGTSSAVRPYLGGGLSVIGSSFEAGGVDDEDASIAAYAHAGVELEISPTLAVGLDLRGLFGSDLELFGLDTDADYTQLAVFLAVVL